jgi:hypothetical protein
MKNGVWKRKFFHHKLKNRLIFLAKLSPLKLEKSVVSNRVVKSIIAGLLIIHFQQFTETTEGTTAKGFFTFHVQITV